MGGMDRRDFLRGLGGVALVGCGSSSSAPQAERAQDPPAAPPAPQPEPPAAPPAPPEEVTPPIPTRPFGKTGFQTTILGLGGAAYPNDRERALAVIEQALKEGINYFDTARIYGPSEDFVGEGLAKARKDVWLTSKVYSRTKDEALADLDESLKRLRTDHLDLWLLHDIRNQQTIDQIFAPGGAIEAAQQAVAEKKVRFVGCSGHADPVSLQAMLDRYPFDAMLMAVNAADTYEKPFTQSLLPNAAAKGIGIIAMKTISYGALLTAISMDEALSYALTLPISVAIVGAATPSMVKENADIARKFKPLPDATLRDIEQRALKVGELATFFRRGTWA